MGEPPSIPTIITPIDKKMSPSQQRDVFLQTHASIPSMHFHIFTDGSARGGIEDSGTGLVDLSQDDLVHEWHAPTVNRSSSFQAEKAALKEAIKWLSSISSWATTTIICNCKSLVQAVINTNSAGSSFIQLQVAVALLAMSIPILIAWVPGHCGVSADHQATLGAADSTRQRTRRSCTESSHPLYLSPPLHPTRVAEGGVHVSPR